MSENEITVGTRVMYARTFLRSISAFTGVMPFARGTVTEIEREIATISWDDESALDAEDGYLLPRRVNVANLVREDRLHLEAR
jgi:hypothetical protein